MKLTIYRKTINKEEKIFKYFDKNNKEITDKNILEYIKKLSIPLKEDKKHNRI